MSTNKGCRPDPRTMPVTKEFEDGYARTFGKGEKQRGRWRWSKEAKKLVEIGSDDDLRYDRPVMVLTDRYMEGVHTIEGHDISSRKKRREYMRLHGLADPQDFTEHRKKKQKEREDFYLRGGSQQDHKERVETIGRELYEIESRKRRSR